MSLRLHVLLPALLLLTSGGPVGSQPASAASSSAEVTLAPDERAVFPGGFSVRFVSVVDDSRCPAETTCARAGEVKVRLAIQHGAAEPWEREMVGGESVKVDEYRLTLVEVSPEPVSHRTIAPDAYRATLKVERSRSVIA